jgi:hypothetical protein
MPAADTPMPDSPPRSLSPTPWERDSVVEVARAEIERQGDKLVRAPESARLPANPAPNASLMAQAEKVPILKTLAILGGASASLAALVTAIGTVVVNIITAQRPASIADLEEKIVSVESRVNGRFGLDLEEKARIAKDEELAKKDADHERDITELKRAIVNAPRIEGYPTKAPDK